ncbi:Holliday junction branch migration protein RuvA [Motilibacter deserti]|uniref:Holliday junction branch migration complex subunit RuvA n=1 Tax=Motilibacter deserti TaxID=2714956 RepID=A0ABX0GSV9_9ACTN|nr:Holliday junction branch migration protein RuvA [Motilibacter deserti]NHC13962.1 Holliday junction branch migration protein RuvA [Motilibacter deserti]
MIAFVAGRVAAIGLDSAVVEVGGVGLAVRCTPGTLATLRPGEPARLSTHLVVREDELTLYGFADDDERTVFETVQTVSGVGPRLAQAILAVLSPDDVRRAVATEDLGTLTKVPGIGKKGAQRLVLELRDKLGAPVGGAPAARAASVPAQEGWRTQLAEALTGLGWAAREAEAAVDAVAPEAQAAVDAGSAPDVAALLRSALRGLSRA